MRRVKNISFVGGECSLTECLLYVAITKGATMMDSEAKEEAEFD